MRWYFPVIEKLSILVALGNNCVKYARMDRNRPFLAFFADLEELWRIRAAKPLDYGSPDILG